MFGSNKVSLDLRVLSKYVTKYILYSKEVTYHSHTRSTGDGEIPLRRPGGPGALPPRGTPRPPLATPPPPSARLVLPVPLSHHAHTQAPVGAGLSEGRPAEGPE